MVKISDTQMDVFRQGVTRSFENEMLVHLRSFSPGHFKILEEGDMRRLIRFGMERAQGHGFTHRRSLRLYIEMMLMLGSGFDTDPQLSRAQEILGDAGLPNEVERIDRLHKEALDYAAHVLPDYRALEKDADHAPFIEELRRMRHEPNEALDASAMPEFYSRVLKRLAQLFPKKCEYVKEVNLRRLIQHGIKTAESYAVSTERGFVLFISMMFLLGGGFDNDPMLPWVSAILNDEDITDEKQRVNKLYAGAVACLKRWWA